LALCLVVSPPIAIADDTSLAGSAPVPADAKSMSCSGRDMLAELAADAPEAYRRIEREAASVENGAALLWRIEKPGLAPSHLFGTVHLTDERVTTLSDRVREALGRSKTVVLEAADISAAATANALAAATKATIFTDGRSLEKMLSPDEFEKVRIALDRAGVPADTARVYRPWVITLLIAASDCERRKIQQGSLVLDMKLAAEAKARGISITGLETIEEQLAAMTSVPEDQQIEMLRAGLKFVDRGNDLVETMVQLYLGRRMGAAWPFQLALAAKAGVSEASFAGFRQTLIVDRNRKMRDGSLPYFEKGGAFVAVGALHLPGATGLVRLLREAGYTATPVE
jgi:hypothetical protein